MTGNERLVAWRGPEPDRVDATRVVLEADRLRARGTSCAPDYVLTYRLDTGPGWVTRELDVHVIGALGERRLELRRDDGGEWSRLGAGSTAGPHLCRCRRLPMRSTATLGCVRSPTRCPSCARDYCAVRRPATRSPRRGLTYPSWSCTRPCSTTGRRNRRTAAAWRSRFSRRVRNDHRARRRGARRDLPAHRQAPGRLRPHLCSALLRRR